MTDKFCFTYKTLSKTDVIKIVTVAKKSHFGTVARRFVC